MTEKKSLFYIKREPESITQDTPLLVLIHGYGSNEQDLFSFEPDVPKDWLVVSLQAPISLNMGGFSWYDIDFINTEKFINVPQAKQSLITILNTIEEIKTQYQLKNPAHLCGFSQGGILSYALALTYPEKFSKIACLSAYPEEKILVQKVNDKKKLSHLKFFISHGTNDPVIPIELGRMAADLLYDLSCYFTFREYMATHGVNQKNYMDLMDFFNS